MSFSFSITDGTAREGFEIGKALPGLWESLNQYKKPTVNELINDEVQNFPGWVLPWNRLEQLYAGVVAINVLRPVSHILFPDEDPWPGSSPGGYWRLFNQYDFETEEQRKYLESRVTWAGVERDLEIAGKVQFIYKKFILNGLDGYEAGDYDGVLSVYFWDFMQDLEKWLEPLFNDSEARERGVRFHGG